MEASVSSRVRAIVLGQRCPPGLPKNASVVQHTSQQALVAKQRHTARLRIVAARDSLSEDAP